MIKRGKNIVNKKEREKHKKRELHKNTSIRGIWIIIKYFILK